MTIYIQHRINRITELNNVDAANGVEIDLRSDIQHPNRIHLSHDPWVRGDDFDAWLKVFKMKKIRGPLILNTKEDGLETSISLILKRFGIKNYFFLDTTLPTLVRCTIKKKNKKFAVRLSRYEMSSSLKPFRRKVSWVWVDCFGGKPINRREIFNAKKNFKICLVSPELQGQSLSTIKFFLSLKPLCDAVCTKRPDLWKTPV